MKLENHVANRFLTDQKFSEEIVLHHAMRTPEDQQDELMSSMIYLLDTRENKTYIVSSTVTKDLGMFDAKKSMDADSWKIFRKIPKGKRTYILPMDPKTGESEVLRLIVQEGQLHMMFFHLTPNKDKKNNIGRLRWLSIWVNTEEGTASDNWGNGGDLQSKLPMIYSLLAFIHLGENEEKFLQPRERFGTAKTFKTQNIFPFPVTVINSAWNHTIKTGEFSVRGHLSIRWTGPGRIEPKLVYIAPFVKTGYTRTYNTEKDAGRS